VRALQPDAAGMPFTHKTSPRCDSPRPRKVTRWPLAALIVPIALLASACDKTETPTSSTDTTTTTSTVASPTITEEFVATVPVGGKRFYSFTVVENGTVNVTLTRVGGVGVPSTVWMGLGIGTPSGEDCPTTSTVNGPSGSTPQVTGTFAPGIYCAAVVDIGNLAAPATIAATIAHP